jgi:hypothetical protein
VCRSDPQIVQQVIFTRMQPFPTLGRGYSRISSAFFAAVMTAALPVWFILIPQKDGIHGMDGVRSTPRSPTPSPSAPGTKGKGAGTLP